MSNPKATNYATAAWISALDAASGVQKTHRDRASRGLHSLLDAVVAAGLSDADCRRLYGRHQARGLAWDEAWDEIQAKRVVRQGPALARFWESLRDEAGWNAGDEEQGGWIVAALWSDDFEKEMAQMRRSALEAKIAKTSADLDEMRAELQRVSEGR